MLWLLMLPLILMVGSFLEQNPHRLNFYAVYINAGLYRRVRQIHFCLSARWWNLRFYLPPKHHIFHDLPIAHEPADPIYHDLHIAHEPT